MDGVTLKMFLSACAIYGMFIIVIGFIGNTISFIVWHKIKSTPQFSRTLLQILACADNFVLMFLVTRLVYNSLYLVDIRFLNKYICYGQTMLTQLVREISINTICVLSFERVIAIMWPLKVKNIFSYKIKAFMYIIIGFSPFIKSCTVAMCIQYYEKGVPSIYRTINGTTYNLKYHPQCTSNRYPYCYQLVTYWDAITTLYIPAPFIMVCNCIIIWALTKQKKDSKNMSVSSSDKAFQSLTKGRSIAKVLLALSAIYIITTVPRYTFIILYNYFYSKVFSKFGRNTNISVYYATSLVNCTNNAANFISYALVSSKFRQAFKKLFCKN